MDYLIGGLAGIGAGFFSNPFDVVKTRMQLQGELKARGQHAIHYRNVVHASYTIVKTDGLLALQKGLVPALWFQLIVNGTRLGMYQTADNYGLIRNENGITSVPRSIFFGAVAGAAGALVGSPLLLIKTQLMSYSHVSIAVGYQHGHDSAFKALVKIYKKNGIKGLWRGSASTMLRNSIGSASQIVTFSRNRQIPIIEDYAPYLVELTKEIFIEKELLMNNPYTLAFIASMLGGLVKAVIMTPMDLIVTRLYNQGVDQNGRGLYYRGLIDCGWKIYRTEGLLAFYKGFGPSYLRQGPHSMLLLVFWDMLKDLQTRLSNK